MVRVEPVTDSDGRRAVLDGDLTFGTVASAYQQITALRPDLRVLELRDVAAVDLAGLQLLYALVGTRETPRPAMSLRESPAVERFRSMAAFCGLPALPETADE